MSEPNSNNSSATKNQPIQINFGYKFNSNQNIDARGPKKNGTIGLKKQSVDIVNNKM